MASGRRQRPPNRGRKKAGTSHDATADKKAGTSRDATADKKAGTSRDADGVQSKADPGRPPGKTPVSLMPLALSLGLVALSFFSRVQESTVLARSFWAAAIGLAAWQAVLAVRLKRESVTPELRVELRSQHYLQAMVQLAVFLYWGYYWRPVYEYGSLLLAQLLFAYAFDMLLAWSRRKTYVLGFGPFPIIFSTNLFLWFQDDWYYLQFVMLGIGFMGKEFVRWNRDGRRVHIFNPSAFSLALFSLVLISTGTTELTWGQEIASTLTLAPNIYLFLFLVGLVVMYFFSITLVAGSAAVVLFGASALYSAVTGVPYFIDSEIPSAVFLGLHLLVTDPSTSPRARAGKVVFGAFYGLGVFALYAILGAAGVPTFYDKLLCVPLLNLSVRWIDRLVQGVRIGLDWEPGRANLVAMAGWVVFFGAMTLVSATDGTHRGDTIPFWEQACVEGRRNACGRLLQLESSYCGDNSGWACNELGRHSMEGKIAPPDIELARSYFSRACEARFQAGCVNMLAPSVNVRPDVDGGEGGVKMLAPETAPETLHRANPRPLDLRLLLREGGGNLLDMPEAALYARACDHGWVFAC